MLNDRQINLLFMIGCLIVVPIIGFDIRNYYESGKYLEMCITISIGTSLYLIFRNSMNKVFFNKRENEFTKLH